MPEVVVADETSRDAWREPERCRHCGDACDSAVIGGTDGPFCCSGCATVFAVLQQHGLGAFYTCDVGPGVSQRGRAAEQSDRFTILDDPATAREFLVEFSEREARAIFRIPTLHCASCVWLVEHLWRVAAGVTRAEVDLMRRIVRVDFDPSITSPRKIAEALTAVGYEPSLDAPTRPDDTKGHRDLILRIGVAGFAFGNVMLFSVPEYLSGQPLEPLFRGLFDTLNVALTSLVLVYSARDYFTGAWRAARRGGMTLDVPVAIGLAVMFARSVADVARGTGTGYFDSFTGLVLFLLVGKLFQHKAFDAIAFDREGRSFLPLFVRVVGAGTSVIKPIQDLVPGETFDVRPHEVVPADALLIDEAGTIDQAFITGEAEPIQVRRGSLVRAGARVTGRGLRLTAVRPASQSTLTELWTHPVLGLRQNKDRWLTDVASVFGTWFTLAACALALLGALAWWPNADMAMQVATAVLIIACPCALTLAAPITLGTAMGVLGRAGCFLKTPAVALDLSRIDHVVFDKTGTLTASARQSVIDCEGLDTADWRRARALAAHSTHPVGRALAESEQTPTAVGSDPCSAGSDPTANAQVWRVSEFAGDGLTGRVDGHHVAIGRASFVAVMADINVPHADGWTWVAVDGRLGRLRVSPASRTGVQSMLDRLNPRYRLSLLSGDHAHHRSTWQPWFSDLAFDQAPADKLTKIAAAEKAGDHVLMVGDGLNDAGALAVASVGMAVSDGTACLVPACDAVVRGDCLAGLPEFLAYARRARHVIVFCFVVSIVYNGLGVTLALRGDLTPLVTAILMPVSSLTIVGLSVGLMRWRAPKPLAA